MKVHLLVRSRLTRALVMSSLFVGFLVSPLLASEKKPVRIRIATDMAPVHNQSKGINYFKKLIEEVSNNEIKVETFFGGALGSFTELVKSLRVGAVEMCIGAPSPLGSSVPAISVFSLPVLFADWEHVDKVLYGSIGDELGRQVLDKTNVRIIGWGANGFITMFNSKRSIKSIEDIKGLKMRTMQNPIKIATWKAFGAQPIALAYTELYGAEQQGVVDGAELSWGAYKGGKHYEVCKYVTEANHSFMASVVLISEKFFQSLSPRHKTIVEYVGGLTGIEVRRITENSAIQIRDSVIKLGAIHHKISPEEQEKFAPVAEKLHQELAPRVGGKELIDRIKKLRK